MADTPPTPLEHMAWAHSYFAIQAWRLPADTTSADLMKVVKHRGDLGLAAFRQLCVDTVNDAVLKAAEK